MDERCEKWVYFKQQNRIYMLGEELLFTEGAEWMGTQARRWRLGSHWCRALILVQRGLLAATSCPLSVRWWREAEGGRFVGPKRTGKAIEGRAEGGERRERPSLGCRLLFRDFTCCSISGGGGGEWGTGGGSRREEWWNCSAACLWSCLATVSLLQQQTYECSAETAGVWQPETHQHLADETRFAKRENSL